MQCVVIRGCRLFVQLWWSAGVAEIEGPSGSDRRANHASSANVYLPFVLRESIHVERSVGVFGSRLLVEASIVLAEASHTKAVAPQGARPAFSDSRVERVVRKSIFTIHLCQTTERAPRLDAMLLSAVRLHQHAVASPQWRFTGS